MTKAREPSDAQDPCRGDTTEPRPWLRERVRQCMHKMARLAVVAATPLANTACDPPPPPSICERSPSDWIGYNVPGQAAWGEDAGERIVLLDLGGGGTTEVRLPATYTIVGGSFLMSTSDRPNQRRIKPEAGATVIVLQGSMTCEQRSAPIRITIDLVPPDGGRANAAPIVKVESQI
jgi:hypothetical protein